MTAEQLCARLRDHGATVAEGPEPLRERIRRAILSAGLETVVVGRASNGKSLNYCKAFEDLFGEPLSERARAYRGHDLSGGGKPSDLSTA